MQQVITSGDDKFVLTQDESAFPTGPPNGNEHRNVFSRLTFSYLDSFFYTGYKRTLTSSDVWQMKKKDSLQAHLPNFENAFQKVAQQAGNDPKKQSRGLLWTVHHAFKHGGLYWTGLYPLAQILLRFMDTFFLYWLIEFVTDAQQYRETGVQPQAYLGYVYAILLFVCTILATLCAQHYYYAMTCVECHIIEALQHFTFKKMLRLSSKARQERQMGELINYISVDVFRAAELCEGIHSLWSIPLTVIIAMGLNFIYFRWSTLAGVGAILLLIPPSTYLAHRLAKVEEEINEIKDQRIKYMNELLHGIRVIKYFCWEDRKKEQVQSVRNAEFDKLKTSAWVKTIQTLVASAVTVTGSAVTFIVYTLSKEGELTTSKVFTSMAIFGMMTEPLM
jgi:ATP-binding cassette subfamily C (CFTR/MRP) protein 1